MGSLTFSSLARIDGYRKNLSTIAKQEQSKDTPISPVSPLIPTGAVNAGTEEALQLSGLKAASTQGDTTSLSPLFAGSETSDFQYTAPSLDFTYNLASIKGILAYRDALLARNSDATGQNLSEKS